MRIIMLNVIYDVSVMPKFCFMYIMRYEYYVNDDRSVSV